MSARIDMLGHWPEAKAEQLRVLWADGKSSAAQIGAQLGMGRNAILGKVHRMKLPSYAINRSGPSQAEQRRARREQWAGQTVGDAITDLPPDESPCAVTILGLTDDACRWPIGIPSALMTYCGAERFKGLPYCSRHACLAFKPRCA